MRRVSTSLTALGLVNALGSEKNLIWERFRKGDQSGLSCQKGYLPTRPLRVGQVKDVESTFPEHLQGYECRNNFLALGAYRQIKTEVQQAVGKFGPLRVGVVMGSSTSGVASTESAYAHWKRSGSLPSTFHYIQHELGGVAEFVAELAELKGPAYTLSTACSSSAKVFASARALIQNDWCDAVVVGGADSLCKLTVQGFFALETLSENPCNSMSRNRNGFNIGEGAALFLLEKGSNGIQLLGVGESSDAYHISAPDPEGRGALAAMEEALKDADLKASDISYLNLHGTGTPLNDQMESLAVSRLLDGVPASSSKGMVGHMLGAAGATEVGFCWLALAQAVQRTVVLPPHLWDGEQDGALPRLSLVKVGQTMKKSDQINFMSNSFGFGGSNCSVIIGAEIE